MSYLTGLVVFPVFFSLSLNWIGTDDLSHSQLQVLFLLSRASPSVAIGTQWYWPSGDVYVYSHLLCCWKRVFVMISLFSWQNSVNLCPASFWTPRPNLPVILGISWLPYFPQRERDTSSFDFLIPVSCDEKNILGFFFFFLFGVSSRRYCRSS